MPLDEQKQIIKIQELYWREKHLINKVIEEKEKFYKAINDKLIERRK